MRTIIALIIWPITLVTFLIAGGIILLAILFIPRKNLHPLIRFSCRLILLSSGQILRVRHLSEVKAEGPYIYMFNHASLYDSFIVGALVKHYITAVGADYQFSYLIWGTLLRRYGIIPIIRTDIDKAISSLDKAEEAIREGASFLISPEGTRTVTGEMLPFKKGGFHVAKHTGATIIPMGFIGALRAKPKNDWRIRPGIITVNIGQPITAADYDSLSVEELRDLVREKIVGLSSGKVR